mmetsp:Transcript_49654/g.153565  ORF Transcript_49654/g.153565 Transcript_49654/m.153565 type:complete len:125 (-) Transcript_49654:470-844(-)
MGALSHGLGQRGSSYNSTSRARTIHTDECTSRPKPYLGQGDGQGGFAYTWGAIEQKARDGAPLLCESHPCARGCGHHEPHRLWLPMHPCGQRSLECKEPCGLCCGDGAWVEAHGLLNRRCDIRR